MFFKNQVLRYEDIKEKIKMMEMKKGQEYELSFKF